MGSVGDAGACPRASEAGPGDNALCKSFFATLECELLERRRFASQLEARMACFSFIEGFYNLTRRHFALGVSLAHLLRTRDANRPTVRHPLNRPPNRGNFKTPKHESWLNMAEIELSALGRDLPDRVGDRATLERHVQAWKHRRNTIATRAEWQFTTNDARIKLRKLYPTIKD